jgi:hypothetical protein
MPTATLPTPPPAAPSPRSQEAKAALRDPKSAASAVLTFWRFVGTGAIPATYQLYDPEVTATLGEADFAGALALQQGTASALTLRVYDIEPVGQGMVVLAETLHEDGPNAWSFFLRREGLNWQIVYDTFTASALAGFVQQEVQRRIDPDAEKASPEALAAADRAVAKFRQAALDAAGGDLPGAAGESS